MEVSSFSTMPNVTSTYNSERGRLRSFNIICLLAFLIVFGVVLISLSGIVGKDAEPFFRANGFKVCGIMLLVLGCIGLGCFIVHKCEICKQSKNSNGRPSSGGEGVTRQNSINRSAGRINCAFEEENASVCYVVTAVPPGFPSGERNSGESRLRSPSIPEYELPPSYEEATSSASLSKTKV